MPTRCYVIFQIEQETTVAGAVSGKSVEEIYGRTHRAEGHILLSLNVLLCFVFCRRNTEGVFIATDTLHPDKSSTAVMEDVVRHSCSLLRCSVFPGSDSDYVNKITCGCAHPIYKGLKFGGIKIPHGCDPELDPIVECCLAAVIRHNIFFHESVNLIMYKCLIILFFALNDLYH